MLSVVNFIQLQLRKTAIFIPGAMEARADLDRDMMNLKELI